MVVRVIDPDRRGQPLDAAKLSRRLGLTARQAEAIAVLVNSGSEGARRRRAPRQQGDPAHPSEPRLKPPRRPQSGRAWPCWPDMGPMWRRGRAGEKI
jgi:hypothetical protein